MNTVPTRPRPVTLMFWVALLIGGWNAGRALALSLNYRTLAAFSTMPTPWLRLGIALFWILMFWGAAFAIGRKRPFTRWAFPMILGVYALFELGLLALYAQAPSARQSWPVNALFLGLLILYSWWALNRTAVKTYFTNE